MVETVEVCVLVEVETPRQLHALESTVLATVANLEGRPVMLVAADDGPEEVVEDVGTVVEVVSVAIVVVKVVLEEGPALFCGRSRRFLFAFDGAHAVIAVVLFLLSEANTTKTFLHSHTMEWSQ